MECYFGTNRECSWRDRQAMSNLSENRMRVGEGGVSGRDSGGHPTHLYIRALPYGTRCMNWSNHVTMQSYVSPYCNDKMRQNLLQIGQARKVRSYKSEIIFEELPNVQHEWFVLGLTALTFIMLLVNWYCVTGSVLHILCLITPILMALSICYGFLCARQTVRSILQSSVFTGKCSQHDYKGTAFHQNRLTQFHLF